MSDIKLYSERELIVAKREANAKARCSVMAAIAEVAGQHRDFGDEEPCSECKAMAVVRYPLPKVTRPRVVVDANGDSWKWTPDDGLLVDRGSDGTFVYPSTVRQSARLVVADLLLNPTEEVDE